MSLDNVPHLAFPSRIGAESRHEDLSVEALLGRPVLDVDYQRFAGYVAGATVLVTGAGGSVGLELCKRLGRLGPRELVLVDQAEAALADAATTLRYDHGFAAAVPVLADIRSAARASDVFESRRPDVVFHTAAYKHVPLLEQHPVEAVATNVLATKSVVEAARRVGVARFVLFSTDKAVRPTSILGQTKAVAEWIVATSGGARYASVRLGNVVDSAGSMLPLFRRQVERGGPVTVTHPEMTRFLMTVGEASALAIVAGALADSRGILWLDSGPPVRILEVARRLAGETPIELVGLRPGERLHEQLVAEGEEVAPTACERVFRSSVRRVDRSWLNAWLAALGQHVERASEAGVRATLAEMHATAEREALVPDVVAL